MKPIKWRKQDQIKLTNYVRKFNSSITKLSKTPDFEGLGILPEKMNIRHIRAGIATRSDFNRIINRIDKWFKRGSRDIVTYEGMRVTNWTKKTLQSDIRTANKKKDALVKKSKISETRRKTENLERINIKNQINRQKKLIEEGKLEDASQSWQNFVYNAFRQSLDSQNELFSIQYYYSYIKSVRKSLEPEHAEEIVNFLEKKGLTGYDIFTAIGIDDVFGVNFVYGPEDSEAKHEAIMEMLEKLFGRLDEE